MKIELELDIFLANGCEDDRIRLAIPQGAIILAAYKCQLSPEIRALVAEILDAVGGVSARWKE